MNRIDPDLFMACFSYGWRNTGRTSSISWRHGFGLPTNSQLVLGQEAIYEKIERNQCHSGLVERLDLEGAWSRLMLWDAPTLPSRSSTPRPTTCWPSRPTSRPCM
jgi:hypothetical protein